MSRVNEVNEIKQLAELIVETDTSGGLATTEELVEYYLDNNEVEQLDAHDCNLLLQFAKEARAR